jgi:hypothetical protein
VVRRSGSLLCLGEPQKCDEGRERGSLTFLRKPRYAVYESFGLILGVVHGKSHAQQRPAWNLQDINGPRRIEVSVPDADTHLSRDFALVITGDDPLMSLVNATSEWKLLDVTHLD